MTYKQEPWTLKGKTVKADIKKRRERQSKFFKENIEISTARIINFFSKDVKSEYTNHDIARALNLSVGTVSAVTNRLQQLRKIKITKNHGPARIQYFQHITGPGHCNVKTMENGDTSVVLLKFFENHKEQLFTKEEIFKELNRRSKTQLETSLKILLISGNVGIYNNLNDKVLKYCYPSETMNCIPVITEMTEEYSSLKNYLKEQNTKCTPDILKNLPEGKLFYSANGLIPVYSREELKKVVSKHSGVLRKIRNALGV